MQDRKLTSKELNQLTAWDNFVTDEIGAVPATIAAMKLKMSTSGLYQAGERGWIKFFKVGRDRWYGRKTLYRYAEKKMSGKNWCSYRSSQPRDCSLTGTDADGDWHPISPDSQL